MTRPFLGVTIGDPAGIGPEIVVKSLNNKDIRDVGKIVVIGSAEPLEKSIQTISTDLKINKIENINEGKYNPSIVNLLSPEDIDLENLEIGKVSPKSGKAAYSYIKKATKIAMEGKIQAVATAPINKKSLKVANIEGLSHTQILSDLTNTKNPLTMFETRGFNLRVFFMSKHVSLGEAVKLVKKDRIIEYSKRSLTALKSIGLENASLAIAGLNPHSGEKGLFGTEENEELEPAIEYLKKKGFNVTGPIPADSVFHLAKEGHYDGVLSLYHDQGHIATKTLDFYKTVSVTFGLPFLRTSVDHGTAFEIAGKNKANPEGMEEAIRTAAGYGPKF